MKRPSTQRRNRIQRGQHAADWPLRPRAWSFLSSSQKRELAMCFETEMFRVTAPLEVIALLKAQLAITFCQVPWGRM